MPAVFAADHQDANRGVDRAADVFLPAVSEGDVSCAGRSMRMSA